MGSELKPLTAKQLASACMSYRHDFGLLPPEQQTAMMLEAAEWERAFRKEFALSQSTEQGERLNDALEEFDHRLSSWAKAYPLSVFPKPDLIRVNEVLKAAGLSLDSVSAECMRHVATKLDELFQPVRAAMSPHGDGVNYTRAEGGEDGARGVEATSAPDCEYGERCVFPRCMEVGSCHEAATGGVRVDAPTGCHRSHPHENMDADCERKTVEARENNARARGMKACEAPSPWKLPPYPATPTEREALAKRQAALGVARPYACPYCDQREGYAHGEWCRGAGTMVKRPDGVPDTLKEGGRG